MKPHDELIERYQQAKAQLPDGLPKEPSSALHEIIMQAAREQVSTTNSIASRADSIPATSSKEHKNTTPTADAANDSFWSIKAFASIAVMGLSALIWWQFEQGTPQEQEAAKTAKPSPAAVATSPFSLPSPSSLPTPAAPPTAVIDQEARAPASRAEKKSDPSAPQVAKEATEQLAKPTAAPSPATPAIAERARTQDTAAAAQVASAEAAVTADAPAGSAAAKSSVQAPASKRFSAEVQGTLSAPTSAAPPAPAARAAAAPALPTPNPLFAALQARDAAALRQALAQGASPNARAPDGTPALAQAVVQRWHEGVRILLAAGAERTAKNSKGHTAADVALELGFSEIVELLTTAK